jgi:hypothetical protein
VPITLDLTLTEVERDQLAGILGSGVDELETRLVPYATAAVHEYVGMFLGQRVFTRGSDILEYRLFLLIRSAFDQRLPDEQRISALFQTSLTGSRSLLRSVMSKYQYELQSEIGKTLRETLEGATIEGDDFLVTLNSENVVEALNRLLGKLDGTLPSVSKKSGTVATYVVRASAYHRLCESCGATAVPAANP